MRPESVAREVFGDDFVEHFAGTREHEIRLWDEAVTDWYDWTLFHRHSMLVAMIAK